MTQKVNLLRLTSSCSTEVAIMKEKTTKAYIIRLLIFSAVACFGFRACGSLLFSIATLALSSYLSLMACDWKKEESEGYAKDYIVFAVVNTAAVLISSLFSGFSLMLIVKAPVVAMSYCCFTTSALLITHVVLERKGGKRRCVTKN